MGSHGGRPGLPRPLTGASHHVLGPDRKVIGQVIRASGYRGRLSDPGTTEPDRSPEGAATALMRAHLTQQATTRHTP
ncbi:hypothetical protein ABZ851_30595 [Streptomyces sp. NPDC047049]|uniref:hypothetical protein n=1 Tax=Streptomyces sp. NPDC047049 TaxID=3156688 RepID=UPI0033D76D49